MEACFCLRVQNTKANYEKLKIKKKSSHERYNAIYKVATVKYKVTLWKRCTCDCETKQKIAQI